MLLTAPRRWRRALLTALLLLVPLTAVTSQGPSAIAGEISSHSGSPLLLRLTVEDPDRALSEVRLLSEEGNQTFLLPEKRSEEAVTLRLSPFLTPGSREVVLELLGEEQQQRWEYAIAFVDFVFGRDNFRFGNNAEYESIIGTYSEILAGWLEERFGEAEPGDLVILTDYMYSLFGENPGRCYAFSGSELRYWRNQELLPSYYDSTYEIRQRVRRYQREMNYLQLDIVYDLFLVGSEARDGRRVIDPAEPQERDSLLCEVERIRERIDRGEPAAVGFIGPELHHSMLAYGYIHDQTGEVLDLLVANNWKSDQELNLRSLDAERVRVFLSEERESTLLEWSNIDGPRERQPNRLFLVEVREKYEHPQQPLEGFLNRRVAELQGAGRSLLLVENAREAWISDGEGAVTGYKDRRSREELSDVFFDQVKRNFRFAYPQGRELWLEFVDDQGARVLHLSGEAATVQATTVSEDEELRVRRRFLLRPDKPLLSESTAPSP